MSNTDFNDQGLVPNAGPNGQKGLVPSFGGTSPGSDQGEDRGQDVGNQLGGVWGRIERSLSPPPVRPREPYLAQMANRPARMWGRDDHILEGARKYPGVSPGAMMPQQEDFRGLLQNSLGGLSKIGSPLVQMLSLGGLRMSANFIKGYIQGQELRMKLADEQFKRHTEAAARTAAEESQEYGIAFDYWNDKPDRLRQEITNIARKHNDTHMLEALNSGDWLARTRKLNEARDAHTLSLRKYLVQDEKAADARRKREREDALLRQFGINPNPGETSGKRSEDLPDDGRDPDLTPDPGTAPDADPGSNQDTPSRETAPETGEETDGPPAVGPNAPRLSAGLAAPAIPAMAAAQPASAAAAPGPGVPAAPPTAMADGTSPGTSPQDPENAPPYQVAGPAMPPPLRPPENLPAAPAPSPVPVPLQIAQVTPAMPGAPPSPGATAAPRYSPQVDYIAKERLMGRKGPPLTGDKQVDGIINTRVTQRQLEMNQQLQRIIDNPNLRTREQVMGAVRQINPQMATEFENYIDGALPPPSKGGAAIANFTLSLGRKFDSGLNADTLKSRAKTVQDFTTGIDARTITAVGTAFYHLDALEKAIRQRPGYIARFLGQYDWPWGIGASAESQKIIGELENDRNTGASEYERALVNGKPAQTARNKSVEELNWRTLNENTLIGNIESKKARLRERYSELVDQFARGTGKSREEARALFEKYGAPRGDDEEDAGSTALTPGGRRNALEGLRRGLVPGSTPSTAPTVARPPLKPGWSIQQ